MQSKWENFVTVSNLPGWHEAPPGPSTVPTQAHWWTRENWSFSLSFWRVNVPHWTCRLWNVSRYCQASPICQVSRHIFVISREQSHRIAGIDRVYRRYRVEPRGLLSRGKDTTGNVDYNRALNSEIVDLVDIGDSKTRCLSFERTGSECCTGAIMTVPPELPPGTLRCSVFLVGIDRGEAAIPFSSDVVCDPRIHVSESGDEPRMLLVIPTRGQHCARYSFVHVGIRLIDAAGEFENVPRNVPFWN